MATAAARRGVPDSRPPRCIGAMALLLGALAAPPAALADVIVPVTGFIGLAGGGINAACTDLIIAGTLNLDSGAIVNLRDVIVQPGGILNGGSGSITLSRNFTVLPGGAYNVERSSLQYDTNCGPGAPVAPVAPLVPIPTLGSGMLLSLSALLALLAAFLLGGVKRQRETIKGSGR